jgi:hypothetical protein
MTILADGKVGIGTADPTVALDVTGAAKITASSSTSTALTTTGWIGVNTAGPTVPLEVTGDAILRNSVRIGSTTAPTVALDVTGAANVSNYLSVGSGGSGSGTTTSILPTAFYVRDGRSDWRDFIPLLEANSTTRIQPWGGPDAQWYSDYNSLNEIAKQYSYFAGYWLNANRAVVGTSFAVESFAGTGGNPPTSSRGLFTFRATAVTNGIVTAYEGQLSAYNGTYYNLLPQQDGIDAGVARRSLSNRTLLMGGSVETSYLGVTGRVNISTSSATATALTTTGRIGVNTATPTVPLDVTGIMRSNTGLKLGNAATTAMTGSSILDVENTGTARARFTSGTNIFTIGVHSNTTNPSESFIYNETSTPMTFGTSGNERMKITADGKVGIGTNSPEASLHVGTSVSISFNGSTRYGYFRNDGGSGTWFINEALNISFIAENDILIKGNHILVSSDKRIKKNIRDIQGATALSQIRRIQPKVYNKIDDIYHQGDIYGFIAQDVEDVINNTSRINTSIIPNFYCKGEIATIDQTNHIYEISTENEFKFEKILDASGNEITNYKIKLYDEKNNDYICIVIHRIDAKTIRVKCDKEYVYSTIEEYKNTVFIYGQEVHDFYNLDKNSIFTVATAALQEVDRQQQADKARIAELEATVASQQSLINDILERLKTNGM